MKKIEMIKLAGGIIVTVGVNAILDNAIKTTTPRSVGTIRKVCISIGAVVLSAIIGEKVVEYTEQKIDSMVGQVKNMVENGDLS